jgi:hypothetical protein
MEWRRGGGRGVEGNSTNQTSKDGWAGLAGPAQRVTNFSDRGCGRPRVARRNHCCQPTGQKDTQPARKACSREPTPHDLFSPKANNASNNKSKRLAGWKRSLCLRNSCVKHLGPWGRVCGLGPGAAATSRLAPQLLLMLKNEWALLVFVGCRESITVNVPIGAIVLSIGHHPVYNYRATSLGVSVISGRLAAYIIVH